MSNAHLGVAPPPSQLQSHAGDLDPSDDETPPVATHVQSSSTAPLIAANPATVSTSKIADAIATLFTHMNVIHKTRLSALGWCMCELI